MHISKHIESLLNQNLPLGTSSDTQSGILNVCCFLFFLDSNLRPVKSLVFAVCLLAFSSFQLAADEESKQRVFKLKLEPLLEEYCFDCHDAGNAEGDFNIAAFKNARLVLENRQTWLRLMQRVSFGDMPPDDGEEMPDEQRDRMLAAIDEMINQTDCTEQVDPGHVTIRRLNRFEYRNTIRDLLGVDYKPSTSFPGDDIGYGFDNIGDVLSLPTLLMEKYLEAAEQISYQAIPGQGARQGDLRELIRGDEFALKNDVTYPTGDGGVVIASNSQITTRLFVPESGKYLFRLKVYGQQAGSEPARVSFGFDGRERRRMSVRETVDSPKSLEMRFHLEKGTHQFAVSFVNDYYKPDAANPKRRDRNLGVVSLLIEGPIDRVQKASDRREIIFVRPSDQIGINQASFKVLQRFASRAYRRPTTKQETRRLQEIVALVVKDGGTFDDGIRLAMQAVLISPHFLYKIEQPPEGNNIRLLNDYELAVSLSYFIWNSMPDDQLFRVSFQQRMREGDNLDREIARMLMDPKAQAMIENFGLQWLQLRNLEDIDPDTDRFPEFDNELRYAMRRETELLLKDIVRNDLSIFTLLEADYTYINETLADHYEILNVRGDEFRKVSLKGSKRRGLLSHASILTITSNPTRTSPVKRGKWVLENLLGAPPPPPAPDVMPLEGQELTGTLREKMKQHREDPSCASCHAEMDPIGFAMENFDAVGRWREKDEGSRIDASGVLPDGTQFDGVAELQEILSRSRRDSFARCFAEKMMTYALGRGLDYYDQCAVEKVVEFARANGFRYSAFVRAVVASDPFQKRQKRENQQ